MLALQVIVKSLEFVISARGSQRRTFKQRRDIISFMFLNSHSCFSIKNGLQGVRVEADGKPLSHCSHTSTKVEASTRVTAGERTKGERLIIMQFGTCCCIGGRA